MWRVYLWSIVAAVLAFVILSERVVVMILDLPHIWTVIRIVMSTCVCVFFLVVHRDWLQRLGLAIRPVRRTLARGSISTADRVFVRETGKTGLASGFQLATLSEEPGVCQRCGGDPSGDSNKYCTGCQDVVPHFPIPGLVSPEARWTYRLDVLPVERHREVQVRLRDVADQIKCHYGMMRDGPLNSTVLYLKVLDVHIWCETPASDYPRLQCGRTPTIKCGVHGLDEENECYRTLDCSATQGCTVKCGYILPSCDRALELDSAKRDPIITTLWIPPGRSVECRINVIWFCLKRSLSDSERTSRVSPECEAVLPPSSSASNVVFIDRTAHVDGGTG